MKNIRTSQLIVPFGIGQIINFPDDEALMVGGLNLWDKSYTDTNRRNPGNLSRNEFVIDEERLAARLNVSKFYAPFHWKERGHNSQLYIYAVRFPRWHHCLKCGKMMEVSLHSYNPPACIDEKCKGKMIPERFISVCRSGHIEDVPFMSWVHKGYPEGGTHTLKYNTKPGSGDLSDIIISCSCGVKRSLAGITGANALTNYPCTGKRPWLGQAGINNPQGCGESLQVVLRGASNVHFSQTLSSLYLPGIATQSHIAKAIINRIGLDKLENFHKIQALQSVLDLIPEVINKNIDADYLINYIIDEISGRNLKQQTTQLPEEAYKFQEYEVFTGPNVQIKKALITKNYPQCLHLAGEDRDFMNKFFSRVVLLEKLRETIAFTGFSRLWPENALSRQDKIKMMTDGSVTWLPATVVYGEGIFFEFNQKALELWTQKFGNKNHAMIQRYHTYMRQRNPLYQERNISSEFVLLHTFAHLLIKRLCFNCGYGSSSLKERIYYSSDPKIRMSGVLIYTSSSDSEGSMGGLVNQGRKLYLADLIREAIEDARWCSADPVCSDVGSKSGQGPGSVNGAACHNCSVVAETCCEEFNYLLDRTTVTGNLYEPELGFFNQ